MRYVLLLTRSDGRRYFDLAGRSLFVDLPFPLLVFTQRQNVEFAQAAGAGVEVVGVQWTDQAAVLRLASQWHSRVGIEAIVVLDETLMNQAAALREALNIPGPGREATERFRNKLTMKRLVGGAGLRVPEHARCTERDMVDELLARHSRLVLKPVDSQGSIGVSIVDSTASLQRWYDTHADVQGYEAEEFIDGAFFHANAFVHAGRPLVTLCAAYTRGNADIDFARGTPLCTRMLEPGQLSQRLSQFSDEVIRALGLDQGVTHLECFLTPDDELVFCEIAARPGGGLVPWMIEAQIGVNPLRACIQLAGGVLPHSLQPDLGGARAGAIGFRSGTRSGVVNHVPQVEDFCVPWVRHVKTLRQPGDIVTPAGYSTDFLGQVVFWSDDHTEFEQRCEDLAARFDACFSVGVLSRQTHGGKL